jgi:hypothetical protein
MGTLIRAGFDYDTVCEVLSRSADVDWTSHLKIKKNIWKNYRNSVNINKNNLG